VLQLEGDRYYVGHTTNIRLRIQRHFEGDGSGWTALHRPKVIVELQPGAGLPEETYTTLKYMRRHGWENVRGGPHVQVHMTRPPHELEPRMSCFRCRGPHLRRDCPAVQETATVQSSSSPYFPPRPPCCSRCGRNTHTAAQCYAKTDLGGGLLPAEESSIDDVSVIDLDDDE
jgi:hypothetical protein